MIQARTLSFSISILLTALSAVIASATVAVYPAGLTFPSQAVGVTGPIQNVTVYNVGTTTFTINTATVNATQFKIVGGTLPYTLAPNQFETFQLQFTPDAAQTFSGLLTFTFTGANKQILNLTATGLNTSAIPTLSATSLNFGDQAVGKNGPSQTLTITNNGTAIVKLLAVTITDPFNQSGFKSATSIAAGQSLSMQVSFVPSAQGSTSGMVMLTYDIAPTAGVSLWGTGTAGSSLGITTYPILPGSTLGYPYQA